MTEPTSEALALALEAAGAPADMVAKARDDYYHDFKSPLTMPEMQLLTDARQHGLTDIVEGVMDGRWDASKEESDAWAASPEGQETFRELLGGNRAQRRARKKRNIWLPGECEHLNQRVVPGYTQVDGVDRMACRDCGAFIGEQAVTFDENSLRDAIVSVWGEHGAHIDVFDHILKLARSKPDK